MAKPQRYCKYQKKKEHNKKKGISCEIENLQWRRLHREKQETAFVPESTRKAAWLEET